MCWGGGGVGLEGGGVRVDVKFLEKFTKKKFGGSGWGVVGGLGRGSVGGVRVDVDEWGGVGGLGRVWVGGGGVGLGGQGGCERRIQVFWKIHKQKFRGGGGVGLGGQVGREGWVGVGVRVDVNEEVKFLGKFTKKNRGGGSSWGGGGSGWM